MYGFLIAAVVASGPMSTMETGTAPLDPTQVAVTCFSAGEVTDGMYKICYYDCLGDRVAITIKSVKLCPLTIKN